MDDTNLFRRGKTGNMRMKFKSTTLSPRALLYKRFIGLEKSINLATVYHTLSNDMMWTFDNLNMTFSTIDSDEIPYETTIVPIEDFKSVLQYQKSYFRFNGIEWVEVKDTDEDGIALLSATFNNISRYQTNKYYYAGSFDCMVKGSVEGTNTQYIKGNVIPLTSLNIKHFDDNIRLCQDDLVVLDGRLYSVENPETDIKHQPRDYNIYFATLNSIL